MENKITTAVISVMSAILSTFLYFKEIIEYSVYENNFFSGLTKEMMSSPVETTIYICSLLLCLFIIAISVLYNKKTVSLICKFLSLAVLLLSFFTIFTEEMPGEGLEVFVAFPVVAVVCVMETVMCIITLVKTKAENNGRASYTVFNIILILFTMFIKLMCWDLSLLILSVMCALVYLTYCLKSDTEVKNKAKYTMISYISIAVCCVIVFVDIYGFYYG